MLFCYSRVLGIDDTSLRSRFPIILLGTPTHSHIHSHAVASQIYDDVIPIITIITTIATPGGPVSHAPTDVVLNNNNKTYVLRRRPLSVKCKKKCGEKRTFNNTTNEIVILRNAAVVSHLGDCAQYIVE